MTTPNIARPVGIVNNTLDPILIIQGACAIIASLAWSDAIRSTIDKYYVRDSTSSLYAKYTFAIVVTIILIIAMMFIMYVNSHAQSYVDEISGKMYSYIPATSSTAV